jgi:hypothetical protein
MLIKFNKKKGGYREREMEKQNQNKRYGIFYLKKTKRYRNIIKEKQYKESKEIKKHNKKKLRNGTEKI